MANLNHLRLLERAVRSWNRVHALATYGFPITDDELAEAARGCGIAHGVKLDLSGIDFVSTDLSGINLSHVNLRGSNLSSCTLDNAELRNANLSTANLTYASLVEADLEDADLREAKLFGTQLRGASLAGAVHEAADVRGAVLDDASVERSAWSDLNRRLWLERGGKIASGAPATAGVCRVFISYRRSDSAAISGRIFDRLAHHFGVDNVFMDVDDIPFGTDFQEHIRSELSRYNTMLVIVGPDWAGTGAGETRIMQPNDPVRRELEFAFSNDMTMIPVLVAGASMPNRQQLPPSLQRLVSINAAPLDVGRDFNTHMSGIIDAIESLEGQ